MATSQEVAQRHSFARSMLERGCRVSSTATMLCAKFHISRSTAYADIKAVAAELDASDDGPASDETAQALDPETIQGQLAHLIDVATATGDVKSLCQLVKAADQVKRWQGYGTPQGGWV